MPSPFERCLACGGEGFHAVNCPSVIRAAGNLQFSKTLTWTDPPPISPIEALEKRCADLDARISVLELIAKDPRLKQKHIWTMIGPDPLVLDPMEGDLE